MHLLNARTRSLEYFLDADIPRYAILSHTWGKDEVSMQDLAKPDVHLKEGYVKIAFTCAQALADGLEYAWVDTCCIDKTSSAELSEAINSMYNWYSRGSRCYAYLNDVTVNRNQEDTDCSYRRKRKRRTGHDAARNEREAAIDGRPSVSVLDTQNDSTACPRENRLSQASIQSLVSSRWFSRGWTLQELIAPKDIFFFGCGWTFLGRRNGNLLASLSERCGIDEAVLRHERPLRAYSIAQRMTWAALRQTSRKEDEAYCLLGIFEVNMPLLYGEEGKAFRRLQEEIVRCYTDPSIFAWKHTRKTLPTGWELRDPSPLLAPSPRNFENCADIVPWKGPGATQEFHLTNSGLSITLPVIETSDHLVCMGVLHCHQKGLCIGLRLMPGNCLDWDPGRKDTHFFCSGGSSQRWMTIDVERVVKAEKRSIVIQTEDMFELYERETDYVQSQLWFRLKDQSSHKEYCVQDLWPAQHWVLSRDPRFASPIGSCFTAKFADPHSTVIDAPQFSIKMGEGVVVLADRRSAHRVTICFQASRPVRSRNIMVVENGFQTPEEVCEIFRRDILGHSATRSETHQKLEEIINIGDSARLHVVLRPESIFGPFDVVLEVTIESA